MSTKKQLGRSPLREGTETYRKPTPPSERPHGHETYMAFAEPVDYKKLLTRLLLKVNRVTCYHRHGNPIPRSALDELASFQEELEEWLEE